MAVGSLGSLRVSLGLDSADFTHGIGDINRKMRAVKSEFAAASDGSKDFARSLDGLTAKSDNLNRQMEVQRAKLDLLKRKYDESVRVKGKDAKATENLLIQYNKARGEMAKLSNEWERTNQAIDDFDKKQSSIGSKIGGIASSIGSLAANVGKYGTALGAAGGAGAALVGAAGGIAAAFASAGAGLAGFGLVAQSVLGKTFEDTEALEAAQKKLDEATTGEERKKAMQEMNQLYAGMTGEQKKAVKTLQEFKSFWGDFTKSFEAPIFDAFTNGLNIAKFTLNNTKPMIMGVANAVVGLTDNLKNSLGSPEVKGIFDWLGKTAAGSVTSLGNTVGNVFKGIMLLMQGFSPIATQFQGGLEGMSQKFANWSATVIKSDGFKKFIEWTQANAPKLVGIVGGILSILGDLIKVLAPIGGMIASTVFTLLDNFMKWRNSIEITKTQMDTFKDKVTSAFQKIREFVQPAIDAVSKFVGQKIKEIKKFWDTDGEQFKEAVQNAFKVIQKVIQFVMPFILALIKSVWGNIKGVINGALKVIMGAIRVFSGLFTGDFKKMWQGVKDIFKGGIQLAWNLINLTFIGRIGKAIKTFGGGLVAILKNSWKDMIKGLSGFVKGAGKLFGDFFKSGKGKFDDLVKAAKALPKRIGDGIKSMASGVAGGVKKLANELAGGIGKGINGLIGGVNWVLGKVGVDKDDRIPKWDVPKYKKGTGGHPADGLAVVGDGKKKELIEYPDGKMALSPATDTVTWMPKGTKVYSGEQTKQIMDGIPKYKNGNVLDDIKNGASNLWSATKDKASDVASVVEDKAHRAGEALKKTAVDVWSYIDDPKKLLTKVYKEFIPDISGVGGAFKSMIGGSMSLMKDKVVDFVSGKMNEFNVTGGGDGSSVGAGSGYGGLHPYVEAYYRRITSKFKGTHFMGGFNNRNVRGGSSKSMHAYGRAFDVGADPKTMKAIAEYARTTFKDLQYVIYNHKIAGVGKGSPWRKYSGVNPHTDHVHVDFKTGGGGAGVSGKGAQAWKGQIIKASKQMKANANASEIAGVIAQIHRESKGDQTITQSSSLRDINVLKGTPAQGLLQYVPSTFHQYMVKGHTNIKNGYDQLLAFFNNSSWRSDLPYGKSGWSPRGKRRYELGGIIDQEQLAMVGEGGWKEAIIPLEKHRGRAIDLWTKVGMHLGMFKAPKRQTSADALGNERSNNTTYNGDTTNVYIAYTGTGKDEDLEVLADKLQTIMDRKNKQKLRSQGVIV
jgi:phage-related protein/SLT domain-containing protein